MPDSRKPVRLASSEDLYPSQTPRQEIPPCPPANYLELSIKSLPPTTDYHPYDTDMPSPLPRIVAHTPEQLRGVLGEVAQRSPKGTKLKTLSRPPYGDNFGLAGFSDEPW